MQWGRATSYGFVIFMHFERDFPKSSFIFRRTSLQLQTRLRPAVVFRIACSAIQRDKPI